MARIYTVYIHYVKRSLAEALPILEYLNVVYKTFVTQMFWKHICHSSRSPAKIISEPTRIFNNKNIDDSVTSEFESRELPYRKKSRYQLSQTSPLNSSVFLYFIYCNLTLERISLYTVEYFVSGRTRYLLLFRVNSFFN